jgi:hypothetical protein
VVGVLGVQQSIFTDADCGGVAAGCCVLFDGEGVCSVKLLDGARPLLGVCRSPRGVEEVGIGGGMQPAGQYASSSERDKLG